MRYVLPLLIALIPTVASAAYIDNRADWDKMTIAEKQAYAMGAFDSLNIKMFDDAPETTAAKRGRLQCLVEMQVPNGTLAKLIDEGYAADVSRFSHPPGVVLINQISAMCGPQIKAERAKLGLK